MTDKKQVFLQEIYEPVVENKDDNKKKKKKKEDED